MTNNQLYLLFCESTDKAIAKFNQENDGERMGPLRIAYGLACNDAKERAGIFFLEPGEAKGLTEINLPEKAREGVE